MIIDELSRDAMLAKQAGLTYGKWRALQWEEECKKNPEAKACKKEQIPEGWEKCEYCRKLFKKQTTKRFCDIYCRRMANYAKESAKAAERYRRKKERAAENGM